MSDCVPLPAAMVNLCRDEVTHAFKHKIDQVFGSSFSVHGLGGRWQVASGLLGVMSSSHNKVCKRVPCKGITVTKFCNYVAKLPASCVA